MDSFITNEFRGTRLTSLTQQNVDNDLSFEDIRSITLNGDITMVYESGEPVEAWALGMQYDSVVDKMELESERKQALAYHQAELAEACSVDEA